MGVGEGTNEIPDHLLDELRKRPIYYESELPQDLPVIIFICSDVFLISNTKP